MSKPEVVEHQCSMSLRCKSDTCSHAKPHTPSDCDCPACCGQWPGNADFRPRVVCIPVEQVRAPEDSGNHEKPEAPLTDHERLQAETERLQAGCEKLRNLLRHAQPIIRAHAEASHMLDGFRHRRNQWDDLCDRIDAALAHQVKEGET